LGEEEVEDEELWDKEARAGIVRWRLVWRFSSQSASPSSSGALAGEAEAEGDEVKDVKGLRRGE